MRTYIAMVVPWMFGWISGAILGYFRTAGLIGMATAVVECLLIFVAVQLLIERGFPR